MVGVRARVWCAVVDAVCVLGLAAGGISSHDEGLGRLLSVAWPFAAGALVGWLLVRAWRRPARVWPTGVVVWLCTWGLGMLLRVATDQGVAWTFQLVSLTFLAVTMLGWRAVAALVIRTRTRTRTREVEPRSAR